MDYIKGRKDEVSKILETLSYLTEQDKFKHKVRVLLLERELDDDLSRTVFTSKTRKHYFTYLVNEKEVPLQLEEMEEDARWSIIEQVVGNSDDPELIDKVRSNKVGILMELDKQDPEKRPLFAFFSGVALREGTDITGWNTNDNLKYHLERLEHKVWSQLEIWKDESLRTPLKHLIWLAAISEYLTFEDMEIIKDLPPFKKLAQRWEEETFWEQLSALFRMERSGEVKADFPGLKPDLLAEYFIATHLSKILEKPVLHAHLPVLYRAAWNISPERVWWMSWLTCSNFLDKASSGLIHYINWISTAADLEEPTVGFFLNNLANFHKDQNRLEEAEQYYLKAIENGHVDALCNLAILYWHTNQNKCLSWEYMVSYQDNNPKKTIQDYLMQLIISAWTENSFYQENKLAILKGITKGHF